MTENAPSFAAGLVGVVLDGRYRLDALLGEGGMGAVYRAHHLAMDRRVAVKLLKPHLTTDDAALERFAREARSTQKVDSPHAVKVLDFGVTPQHDYYMVLEYLDGRTVQRELEVDGTFAPARVAHVAHQVLDALTAAHRVGLVHRDLKPDNILLLRVGEDPDYTKVLDFGVAKLMDGAAASSRSALAITQAGMVFGTPEFMSPEQACGHSLDGRSDLYSLAATMFAMLTGCGLFECDKPIVWLTCHATQPPPHLADVMPSSRAIDELDALMQRCLAKRPEQRPASADEMSGGARGDRAHARAGLRAANDGARAVAIADGVAACGGRADDEAGAAERVRDVEPVHRRVAAGGRRHRDHGAAAVDGKRTSESTCRMGVPAGGDVGVWLAIGAAAVVGVIVIAIVLAAGHRSRGSVSASMSGDSGTALATQSQPQPQPLPQPMPQP